METDKDAHCGTDSNGLIALPVRVPVQPVFEALLEDAQRSIASELGPLLDSLYVYGSVSRGEAIPGRSDLDLTLVLSRAPTTADSDLLETLRTQLQERHPEVIKIDFDVGTRQQALDPAHLHSWGYWLKHQCVCLRGEDLAAHFSAFAPSQSIALAVNGDYVQVLNQYLRKMAAGQDPAVLHRLQREASRKLIRATNILRTEDDKCWPRTLQEHAQRCARQYPDMQPALDFFLHEATSPTASTAEFMQQLNELLHWMQARTQTPL